MSGPQDERAGRSGEHPDDPETGSLGEETAKLLGALAGWAREQDLVGHVTGFAEGCREAEAAEEVGAHPGHGGPECRWCPLCRAAGAVPGISPEVRAHLASAAVSLARAAEALLSTEAPAPSGRGDRADGSGEGHRRPDGAGRTGVEHIDLDGWDEDQPGPDRG